MSGPPESEKKLYVFDPKPYFSAYEISKVKKQGQGRGRGYQYQNQNRYKERKYLTPVRPGRRNEILNVPVVQENSDNIDSYSADPVQSEDISYEENDLSLVNPPEKLVQFNDYPYFSTIETVTVTSTNSSSEQIHSAGAFLSSLGLALILVILLLPLGALIYYVFYRKEGDSASGREKYKKKFKEKLGKGRKEKEYQKMREKAPGFYFDTSEESLLLNAYEKCVENKNKQSIKHQKLPELHQKHQPTNHPCFPEQPNNTIVQIKCDECVFSLDETLQSELDKSNKIKCKKKDHRKSSQDTFKECKKRSKPPCRSRSKRKTRSRFVTTTIPISCTSNNGESNAEDQQIFARYDSSRPVVDYSKMNKYHISDTDDCDNDVDGYTRTRDYWTDRRKEHIIQNPQRK